MRIIPQVANTVHPIFYLDTKLWEVDGVREPTLHALQSALPKGTRIEEYYPNGYNPPKNKVEELKTPPILTVKPKKKVKTITDMCLELYSNDVPVKAICDRLSLELHVVRQIIADAHKAQDPRAVYWRGSKMRWTQVEYDKLEECLKLKMPRNDIERLLGVSHSALAGAIWRLKNKTENKGIS